MAEENIQTNAPEQDLSEILKVRREKLAALRAEGRDPFKETRFDVTHHAQDIKDNFDALEGSEVRIAGRLMSKRGMGKVSFCDLQDKSQFAIDDVQVVTVDATGLALEILGRPITNVPLLGALIAATGITSVSAVEAAIDDQLAPKLREKNKKLLNKTYEIVKEAL